MSAIEANANAVVGLSVSWAFTYYGLQLFGFHPTVGEATWITGVYFVLSALRCYVVRRIFNAK